MLLNTEQEVFNSLCFRTGRFKRIFHKFLNNEYNYNTF